MLTPVSHKNVSCADLLENGGFSIHQPIWLFVKEFRIWSWTFLVSRLFVAYVSIWGEDQKSGVYSFWLVSNLIGGYF